MAGRVLLIRGIFNVFSTGMDTLAWKLYERGYDIEVTAPSTAVASAIRLRQEYMEDPGRGPVVIIGHSMGGRACLHISRYLESYNIPVRMVVITDANVWTTVPRNVQRCVNLYVTNDIGIFYGSAVRGEGDDMDIVNVDATKLARPAGVDPVNHFNIDKSPWIHQLIIAEMARACLGRHSAAYGALQDMGIPPEEPNPMHDWRIRFRL